MKSDAEIVKYFNDLILDRLYERDIIAWVAGGAIVSLLSDSPIKDVDLFFPTETDYEFTKRLLLKEGKEYRETENSYSIEENGVIYDLVKKPKPGVYDLIIDFPFRVQCFGVDRKQFHHIQGAKDDVKNKTIHLNTNLSKPAKILLKLLSYVSRGYTIENEELNKLVIEIRSSKDTLPDFAQSG